MTMLKLWNLKKAMAVIVLLTASCGATWAQAAVPAKKTTVVYFGQMKNEEFESKVKPLFAEKIGSCKSCELINFTPYTKEGEVDGAALKERIETLPADTSFVFFDYNMRVNEQNKGVLEALNKKADAGLIVVGTAGAPKTAEASGPLSRTLLGQVHGALIIGELAERDRLMPTGFYGPEMLTALRPPKDMMGQGHSPLLFAAALAEKWPKRTSQEWADYFRTKKMKTRKIWLELGDLF